MFGLIGKFTTAPGKREEVMAIIGDGSKAMPGCVSYIIAADATDPDTIWVTEVWESEDHHQGSLQIPDVRAAIDRAMPLITGGEQIARTRPLNT